MYDVCPLIISGNRQAIIATHIYFFACSRRSLRNLEEACFIGCHASMHSQSTRVPTRVLPKEPGLVPVYGRVYTILIKRTLET